MIMPTSDYKKTIPNTFYHTAVLGAGALIINYGLDKGKIVGKTELEFDMRDASKLCLSAGEFIHQKMVGMGLIPASLTTVWLYLISVNLFVIFVYCYIKYGQSSCKYYWWCYC